MTIDAKSWINAWVDENLVDGRHRRHKEEMAREAITCRAAASETGIGDHDFGLGCDDDILQFLFERQAAVVDYEARRVAESDRCTFQTDSFVRAPPAPLNRSR